MKTKTKKRRYQTGGPVEPNYQTLGDIKFDSNKIRKVNGILVAKDVNSGKDYGVLRQNDGTYDFYRGVSQELYDTGQKLLPHKLQSLDSNSDKKGMYDP